MKTYKWAAGLALASLLAPLSGSSAEQKTVTEKVIDDLSRQVASTALTKRLFSVSVNGATAESVIRMVSEKAGVGVQLDGDFSKRVNYSFANTTLENAMQQMASDVGFDYSIRNNVLVATKSGGSTGRSTASQNANIIELKYVDAEEMGQKLKSFVREGEDIHVDKKLNSIVVVGSETSFQKVRSFVQLFDRMPQQILIEAKIVEASETFSREVGFLGGDLADTTLANSSKRTGYSSPKFSSAPTFGFKYKLGAVNGRNLDLRILAAESKGDAKVISKPKVVTINNIRALINSGLTLNVKTLSTVQNAGGTGTSDTTTTSTSGSSGNTFAGGVQQLEAGLQLGVLPSVVNTSMVRLVVDVNNSQPDTEISVDGIPGISTNSANTSIIVESGSTAIIAGLIKNSSSKARSGVPFLSDIPILGLLFRTDSQSKRNSELIIFITPRILTQPGELNQEQGGEELAGREGDAKVN